MTARGRTFIALGIAVACAAAIAAPPVRHAVLRTAGEFIARSDPPQPADLIAVDWESEEAGQLEASDLYHRGIAPQVVLLGRRPTAVDRELHRRGVAPPNVRIEILAQLGVPRQAIVQIDAGEAGTTESTAALASWVGTQRKKVIVIVGPSHGRRYRRTLRRVWPAGAPPPSVVVSRYGLFKPDGWWRSRTTLREGLVEFQKVALDYLQHPL